MTISFEEAEAHRAAYRKLMAEKEAAKNKPKEETKAKLPDETVSSEKSGMTGTIENALLDVVFKSKKKRGRPKKELNGDAAQHAA